MVAEAWSAYDQMLIQIKWNKNNFKIADLNEKSKLLDLKLKIFDLTNVLPDRQKLIGIKGKDDDPLEKTNIKDGMKIMVIGSNEQLDEYKPVDEIKNDLEDFCVEEETALHLRQIYLDKIQQRIDNYNINVFTKPRPDKNLLVLDIDGTIFDHKSYAEKGSELMRPYLHDFLHTVYEFYDICIWSATNMKYIESKISQLGQALQEESGTGFDYKISFFLDRAAMISVYTEDRGLVDVKPLGVIWGKFPEYYNADNTVIVDDCRHNFLMNPNNGIKIYAYHNTHDNVETKDEDLLWLGKYLSHIAIQCKGEFSKLDHSKWKKNIKNMLMENAKNRDA